MNTVCNKISFGKKNPTMCTPTAGFFQHLKLNDLKNLKIAYKKVARMNQIVKYTKRLLYSYMSLALNVPLTF